MKNKIYRFKTKTEFIAEFGDFWFKKINAGWVNPMNVLFGALYTGRIPGKPRSGECEYGVTDSRWSVSSDMLTTKRLPKILKDGTIAKVNMKVLWSDNNFTGTGIIQRIYCKDDNRIIIACTCGLCKGLETRLVKLEHITKDTKK